MGSSQGSGSSLFVAVSPELLYGEHRGWARIYDSEPLLIPLEQILTGNDLYTAVHRRVILTHKAREYQEFVDQWVDPLPVDLVIRGRAIHANYVYMIPASKLETSPGELVTQKYDLTNLTKPTEDAIFRKLGIDDSYVTSKFEAKLPSHELGILFSFSIFGVDE